MAEQQAPPTFKLVLVGDGGTGKVRTLHQTTTFALTPKMAAATVVCLSTMNAANSFK